MSEFNVSAFLDKYNPAVRNRWHIALAGMTWAGVGLLLCRYSYTWLSPVGPFRAGVFALVGFALSLAAYRFGMSKIARKNLDRLTAFQGRKCIFGFLTWNSYLNIGVMVTMGVTLRHSALPKDYLSLVYTSMGSSLLMGSLQYFKGLLNPLL